MEANTVLARSPEATFEVVAEEAMLIHVMTGYVFTLNKVSTEFWEMLDGQRTLQDHAEVIAAKYDVGVDMVLADLIELTEKMSAEQLLVEAG